jgi:type III pantothenate kinase
MTELTATMVMDIGNTNTRAALVRGRTVLARWAEKSATLRSTKQSREFAERICAEIKKQPMPVRLALSSVVPKVSETVIQSVERVFKKRVFVISHDARLNFTTHYTTPHTLGRDRIALLARAVECFPKQAVIAVDFGTAITYDILTSKHSHLGGVIIAGVKTALTALSSGTAQLPDVRVHEQKNLIGTSTVENLEGGAYWGAIAQTDGLITRFKTELTAAHHEKKIAVLATGGDAELLSKHIAFDKLDPDAVLFGIEALAELNA